MRETPEDWRHRANCKDTDPDLMQPEVATPEDVEAAKAVCVECPVAAECLALARSQRCTYSNTNAAYGVYAGKWFGPAPARPRAPQATDVVGADKLRELFASGWSIRKVAAEYGLTVKQVRVAREKLAA